MSDLQAISLLFIALNVVGLFGVAYVFMVFWRQCQEEDRRLGIKKGARS